MKNFKLTIQYDGTFFHGWQFQPNQITVQGNIERVLQPIFSNQKINLVGSGRTDSGVHAMGQVANILIDTNYSPNDIKNILNARLDRKIWISDCIEVDLAFHARFSASSRYYEYHMTKIFNPFNYKRSTLIKYNINEKKLFECSDMILGEKDFSSFCKANAEVHNKICVVYKSAWAITKSNYIYQIEANRFLQHMVRLIVGSMIEVARDRYSIEQFQSMLTNQATVPAIKAPPDGLFLQRVAYD